MSLWGTGETSQHSTSLPVVKDWLATSLLRRLTLWTESETKIETVKTEPETKEEQTQFWHLWQPCFKRNKAQSETSRAIYTFYCSIIYYTSITRGVNMKYF